MPTLSTSIPELELVSPDPERDAPFALAWFESPHGKETLLLMGNTEDSIEAPTLEGETKTLEEFIELEKANQQLTWMIHMAHKAIGAAWIDLVEQHGVDAPSVHIMIGDSSYRGRGVGKAVMSSLITYLTSERGESTIFSRHLVRNEAVGYMMRGLGFENQGQPYVDKDGLEWQNIRRRDDRV